MNLKNNPEKILLANKQRRSSHNKNNLFFYIQFNILFKILFRLYTQTQQAL